MESPDSEQKKALLTGFDKSTSDMQYLEVQKDANLNDSVASDASTIVEKTSERFWVLFLFGCSTCINACGWISVAPVFLLVEDVSTIHVLLCFDSIVFV